MKEERRYFFLSDYYDYDGCVTFTAHLLHSLRKKSVLLLTKKLEENTRGDFGYGIQYHNTSTKVLEAIKNPFITDMYKTFQEYLKNKYDVNPKFLHQPFYPYPTIQRNANNDDDDMIIKTYAVSISRVDYGKHIDIITDANKLIMSSKNSNNNNNNNNKPIKIYGPFNPKYVHHKLGKETFKQYYYGTFEKSFAAVSKILSKAKFMVDLSVIRHDGGGTQYTFLEAVHNNTALIMNRKWIEDVDPKYRDFKEGYNCYAVSNGQELAEIINNSKNIDTTQIVYNAKKLIDRHIKVDWSVV